MENFDITTPVELTNALIENMPPSRFLTANFFGEQVHGTEMVGVDIVKGTRKIAPYVARNGESVASHRDEYTTRFFNTHSISLKRPTDAIDMFKRAPGEGIVYAGSARNPAEAAAEILGRDQSELANMVLRTIEKYAADAFFDGNVTIKDVNGNELDEIDFGVKDTHYVTKTGTALWTGTAADICGDLEDLATLVARDSGLTATDAILGSKAAAALLKNEKVQKLLDIRSINAGILNVDLVVGNGARFLGNLGGLRIWRSDEVFADNDGKVTPIVPANKVLVLSKDIRATVHYGLVNDVQGGKFAAKMFSKTWEQDDPSVNWLCVKSSPLPVIEQADGFAVATVVSA